MKNLNYLDKYRVPFMGDMGNESNGAFRISIKGKTYIMIASNSGGWEHVSISHEYKIPTWEVMCMLKDLFFEESETVMQLHPAQSDYVNIHNNCLHLWRPIDKEIPMPPKEFV